MTGKMPVETELKLALAGRENEAAIMEALQSHGYAVEALEAVVNVDLYMDTFDWLLMKKKLALRYRVCGDKAYYTVKGLTPIEDGVAIRPEVEVQLDEPLKKPTDVRPKRIKGIIGKTIYPRKLIGQIEVRTDRRRYCASTPGGARLEIAFDTATFYLKGLNKRRRSGPVHEFEAELVEGDQAELGTLAALLEPLNCTSPCSSSKLELAIKRLKVAPPSGKPKEKQIIRSSDRLDLAMKKFLAWQMERLRDEIPGLRLDIDSEFVHKARVATRRMRSALRLIEGSVPPTLSKFFAGELRWLARLLGDVRDIDVFQLNLERFRKRLGWFSGKQRAFITEWIKEIRREPLKALVDAFDSSRYEGFERRVNNYLNAPLPKHPGTSLAGRLVHQAAPALIDSHLEAVLDHGRLALENHKLKEFHMLRIQVKRLRYTCELVSSAYDGTLDDFIERMTQMQDCLGAIQDTVFMKDFIENLFKEGRRKLMSPAQIFSLGEIYQLFTDRGRLSIREFDGIWQVFASEESINEFRATLGARETPAP